jgi:hypothetical protein
MRLNSRQSIFGMLVGMLASTCLSLFAVAAEPGAFIDLENIPLQEAAEFVARLTGYAVELGPGATGRITMSSPRALTYVDVLETFDKELARNGMTAIKRGHAMLIVPLDTPPMSSIARREDAPQPAAMAKAAPAAEKPQLPTLRFQAYVSDNRVRVEHIANRLTGAGVKASTLRIDEDSETTYVLVIESANSDASLSALAAVIKKLDLGDLLTLPML